MKLQVDEFEIDDSTLTHATGRGVINRLMIDNARAKVVELVVKNLVPESQDLFKTYLHQYEEE